MFLAIVDYDGLSQIFTLVMIRFEFNITCASVEQVCLVTFQPTWLGEQQFIRVSI